MKRIFFLLLTIVCINNGLQAQLSEKFLKLNRVVVLDSVKSKTFTSNYSTESVYTIVIPAGVFWKIESMSFNPSFDQSINGSIEVRVKINTADVLFQVSNAYHTNFNFQSNNASVSVINNFLKTTPTWAGPGSVLNMYVKNSNLSGKTLNFEMTLAAMEFILE
jgi:hypothetical protein